MRENTAEGAARRPFLTATWRYLAMLNYEVDPVLLRPLVPAGTELDTWEGQTLASIVGFRFLDTRLLGLPVPGHGSFDEVNLRFYVRRRAGDGNWRRGVVFVKEIVPRRAIAVVARICYNEPYIACPMRHEISMGDAELGRSGSVRYEWYHRGQWHRLQARTEGEPRAIAVGSEEEFITEHYWGYTGQRDGGCEEYQVEHPRWSVWKVTSTSFECDIAPLYGPGFVESLNGQPRSAFLADGSAVSVHRGTRLPTLRNPL
jgi:uncharacterized protein YqjF (DUF2071 family)